MNVTVLPPDVNSSEVIFGVRKDASDPKGAVITFGLSAIKGCGGQAAEALVAERTKRGPFRDLFDFCERLDPGSCNRATIESLIKAGGFDSLGARRSQYSAVLDRALQTGASAANDRKTGQTSLFGGDDEPEDDHTKRLSLPDLPEWDEKQKLICEKEVLGYYLTSHPLAEYQAMLSAFCTHTSPQCVTLKHRTEVMLGGMMAALKFSNTKNPKPGETNTRYVMFDLEDTDGIMRCILWPRDFAVHGHLAVPDAIVAVRGSIDRREGSDEINLIVNEIIPMAELAQRFTKGIRIRLDETQHGERGIDAVAEILRGYPGNCDVEFSLWLADGMRVSLKSETMRVGIDPELRRRLEEYLGPGNIRMLAEKPKPSMAADPRDKWKNKNGNGNGKGFAKN